MIIRQIASAVTPDGRFESATVCFEDREIAPQRLLFAIADGAADIAEPAADAFLAACFPLAAVHGERRLYIEGDPCPMLIEGLRTVHAWWTDWGGMPGPAPVIETGKRRHANGRGGSRRAVAFLSGGVDSLHMLMRNRQIYREGDPAYIHDALCIHGFDIGKRAREPEGRRFRGALARLEPIAAETGVRIVSCWTNLRHLPSNPSTPDFWSHRQNVGALAAVGHAATCGPTFLFVAGGYPLSHPVPMGTHPAVDGLYSSQRVTVLHEGARFSRLDKVRDLANWPAALAALRVCAANVGDRVNCGNCEKCLLTRLELLAAGVEETPALGPSLTTVEEWEVALPIPIGHRALRYKELLPPLRARGHGALSAMLERKIALYRRLIESGARWPGL
jgi:hypothetical protein